MRILERSSGYRRGERVGWIWKVVRTLRKFLATPLFKIMKGTMLAVSLGSKYKARFKRISNFEMNRLLLSIERVARYFDHAALVVEHITCLLEYDSKEGSLIQLTELDTSRGYHTHNLNSNSSQLIYSLSISVILLCCSLALISFFNYVRYVFVVLICLRFYNILIYLFIYLFNFLFCILFLSLSI